MPIVLAILFGVGLLLVKPDNLPPFLRIFQHGLRNTLIILKPLLILALLVYVGLILNVIYEKWRQHQHALAQVEEYEREYKAAENNIPEYGTDAYVSWSTLHEKKAVEYEQKLNGQDSTGNYILNPHPVNSSEAQAWKADSTAFEKKRIEQKKRDQFVANVDSLAEIK